MERIQLRFYRLEGDRYLVQEQYFYDVYKLKFSNISGQSFMYKREQVIALNLFRFTMKNSLQGSHQVKLKLGIQ